MKRIRRGLATAMVVGLRVVVVVVVVAGVGAGCAGPPWLMGRPLDGSPSIPASALNISIAQRRAEADAARRAGHPVEEFAPLLALEALERLSAEERARLVALLLQRAGEFAAMDRAIPRSQDLEHAVALAPEQGVALRAARARALRAAGDAWLAIGERPRARVAYARAGELGAADLSYRLMAATDEPPPGNMPLVNLAQAIAALPLRVLRPFGDLYLRLQGSDRPTLQRLLAAARQDGDSTRVERLREALDKAPAPETTAAEMAPPIALVGVPAAADLDRWILTGPLLSRRLLPLLAASPDLLAPSDRTRHWSELLLAEDPTSPEVQEVAALIDGLGRRFGGAERKLTDLIYYTPDRFDGFLRAAVVWQRVGRPREACVQRVRAARWRDDPEDPTWREAIACTRSDPGAGDWRAIRQYVLNQAPEEKRQALAASLDSSDTPSAPVARPAP